MKRELNQFLDCCNEGPIHLSAPTQRFGNRNNFVETKSILEVAPHSPQYANRRTVRVPRPLYRIEQWSSNCVPRNPDIPRGISRGSTSHNKN
ncbi:hypothetical protein TNCV_2629921 [Trichonephila clavipes]|uniref:Uncharacterized protein n=1 Tax=Trichonephila clavipes TaxID=2585209 RepID=A0A8X6VJT8_TRICX|nr:hypothetical protein TNCV_2629921 [Trichonephila clavipes]